MHRCVEHQLVGCKKVQQQLALPGELEKFMSVEEANTLRSVFAGLWSLAGPAEPADSAPCFVMNRASFALRATACESLYLCVHMPYT